MLVQTTDSGSNNNTMASAMYNLMSNSTRMKKSNHSNSVPSELEWDPATMHICCVCHKLALIVNAGLKALLLQTLPPGKAKESVLVFFPVLGRLAKEDEPEQSEQPALENKKESPLAKDDATWESDYGNANARMSDVGNETSEDTESNNDAGPAEEKSNPKTPATSSKHAKSTKLLDLTQKVRFSYLLTLMSLSKFNHLSFLKLDGVIKQITRSAAQRLNFD